MYMTERKIMKTISEMNQDEKTELLKTIEENRLDKTPRPLLPVINYV